MKNVENVGPGFWVSALLFMQLCLDGYDITILSFTAPIIVEEWGLDAPHHLGTVFSAGLAGMLVGSVLGGFGADQFGPKRALIASTLIVSVFTLAVTGAQNLEHLLLLRALAGIGLGAALPCIVRLLLTGAASEKAGSNFVFVCLGVNIGAALPGLLIAAALPIFGWRGLFAIGGILPALLVICLAIWLPRDETGRSGTRSISRAAIPQLFAGKLGLVTPILWMIFFFNSAALYAIVSWAPTLATKVGMSIQSAGLASSALQIGGLLAGLLIGVSRARLRLSLLAAILTGGCLCVAAMGFTIGDDVAYSANLFLLGGALFAALFTLNFLGGWLYPSEVRGTGSGIASAFGRIGSLAGPMAGASLIGVGVSAEAFVLAALPLLAAAGLGLWGATIVGRDERPASALAGDTR